MAETAKRAATYEDLLAVPEPLVAEILHGEPVAPPRRAARHASAASRLEMILGAPFEVGVHGAGDWVFREPAAPKRGRTAPKRERMRP